MHAAFAFRTSFSIAEMRERLDGVGGRAWIDRDNDHWGDYTSSITNEPYVRMRILYDDDIAAYALDLTADDEAVWRELVRFARETVLVLVDASNVREVGGYER
jgi:hypothetical protein